MIGNSILSMFVHWSIPQSLFLKIINNQWPNNFFFIQHCQRRERRGKRKHLAHSLECWICTWMFRVQIPHRLEWSRIRLYLALYLDYQLVACSHTYLQCLLYIFYLHFNTGKGNQTVKLESATMIKNWFLFRYIKSTHVKYLLSQV